MEPTFQFGALLLDPARRTLRKGNLAVHLTPKEFEILRYLLENPDRVVSRDELMTQLWPGVVVEEANLTQNIFLLRKALGETPSGKPYIETIPKRGYRIAVPVKRNCPRVRRSRKALLVVLLLVWSLLCFWLGYWHSR